MRTSARIRDLTAGTAPATRDDKVRPGPVKSLFFPDAGGRIAWPKPGAVRPDNDEHGGTADSRRPRYCE